MLFPIPPAFPTRPPNFQVKFPLQVFFIFSIQAYSIHYHQSKLTSCLRNVGLGFQTLFRILTVAGILPVALTLCQGVLLRFIMNHFF